MTTPPRPLKVAFPLARREGLRFQEGEVAISCGGEGVEEKKEKGTGRDQ